MNEIDMHIHSNCSDGTLSVDEILMQAKIKKLRCFSICDHDTFKAYDAIHEKIEALIMGIEISAHDYINDKDVHILAYGMNSRKHIEKICNETLVSMKEIALWQINQLKKAGYNITQKAVKELAKDSTCIYKQHIMQELINQGYAKYIYGDEYQTLFKNNGICSCKKYFPDFKEVIKAVHQDGGIAVLAHPKTSGVEVYIKQYVEDGLDGIETYHSSQDAKAVHFAHLQATTFHLFETGGSDCHGLFGNEPEIGKVSEYMNDEEVYACIKKRLWKLKR